MSCEISDKFIFFFNFDLDHFHNYGHICISHAECLSSSVFSICTRDLTNMAARIFLYQVRKPPFQSIISITFLASILICQIFLGLTEVFPSKFLFLSESIVFTANLFFFIFATK